MKEAALVSLEFGRSAVGRWLFVVAAIVVTIIVLLGFTPSYLMRLQHHDRNLIWLVHLHGLLTALWIALFLIQALLIARRRADLHRRFGAAGAGLAILVFCTGAATLVHAAQRRGPGLNAARGVRYLEMLVVFDGFGLLAFAGLVAVALRLRRRPEWHKRLMLLATLSLLGPAFGRITAYVNHMHGDNDVGVLLLCVGCVVICAVVDSVRHRRLHQAFVGGGGLVLTMYLTTYVAKTLL